MDRYGGDFNRRPMMRYGGEYQQWGGMPRYDQEFGNRGDRSGRFYDRDFSGYETRTFRPAPRYDRGYSNSGYSNPGYTGRGYGNERYGQQYRPSNGPSQGYSRYATRDTRGYPSPWDESHPGQNYGFGLGFGQGRGQFIYK
jgi:hypothetical protein